jgi:NADH-quinone oxidoreductase subunit G/[NiFe] hydrogenase diaphorase moiety small subunit
MIINDNVTDRAPVSQQALHVDKPTNVEDLGSLVEIEINGTPIKVPMGTTILEAARQYKIHIPTLCYHEDLCLAGVCRICVVEIEGMKTLQAACTYPITTTSAGDNIRGATDFGPRGG